MISMASHRYYKMLCIAILVTLVTSASIAQLEPIPIDPIVVDKGILDKVETTTEDILGVISIADLKVFGTEYQVGDNGTVWIQLLDVNKIPINNATCRIDIYYPNKVIWHNGTGMVYLQNSDGLYFLDVMVPDATGVYMTSVTCSYEHDLWVFNPIDDSQVRDGAGSNTNYGNITYFAVGDYWGKYEGFVKFDISTARDYYESFAEPKEIVAVWLLLYCDSIEGSVNVTVQEVYDYWSEINITWNNKPTSFSSIIDTELFSGLSPFCRGMNVTDNVRSWIDNESYVHHGFYLNTTQVPNNIVAISSKEVLVDSLSPSLIIEFNQTEHITEVKGSGELHVSSYASDLMNLIVAMKFVEPTLVQNHDTCLDNQTLVKDLIYLHCFDGDCVNYTQRITINCPHGCWNTGAGTGECAPAPIMRYAWLIAAFIGVLVVFGIIYFLTK